MSSYTGTVISVSLTTQAEKKEGGYYPAWELIYRDSENRVKTLQKHISTLKYTKGLKESLESLSAGDSFTVTQEKNDKGFLDIQSIVKGEFAVAPVAATVKTGKVTGSNYETTEERELNRSRIVRQSSIGYALTLLTHNNPKGTVEVPAVLALAEQLHDWVYAVKQDTSEPV